MLSVVARSLVQFEASVIKSSPGRASIFIVASTRLAWASRDDDVWRLVRPVTNPHKFGSWSVVVRDFLQC